MMKKLYIGLILSLSLTFAACDMDVEQEGVVTIENAIQSKIDCDKFMNTIYNDLRATTGGGYISCVERQMDKFVGTVENGNRGMLFSSASIAANDGDVNAVWFNMYIGINDCNFFIPRAQAILGKEGVSAKDAASIACNIGEAKFARAYFYWYLMDHFCESYTTANANTPALGVPIVLVYSPSANRGTYPGRSTLQQTVDQINKDLSEAYEAIKDYEENVSMENVMPCASRLNSYAVKALQARMALLTGDYATAILKAEDVISSQIFELTERDAYADMWAKDEGTELIFVPFGDNLEYASVPATGKAWLTNDDRNTSDFIPTPEAYSAYDDADIRKDVFFTTYTFLFQGNSAEGPAFNKFPGNAIFKQGNENDLRNKPKPFRTSELYLIIAEAAAADGPSKDEAKANSYLNELRSYRIEDYRETTLSGSALVNAVRAERAKELIGEGFRMSDLRRWNQGFTRSANYTTIGFSSTLNAFVQPNSQNVTYTPGYYMFVWPIPQAEMDVNPQLAGQQNKGY